MKLLSRALLSCTAIILLMTMSVAFGQSSSVPDDDYEPIDVTNLDSIVELLQFQDVGTVSLAWSATGTRLALGNTGGFVNLYDTFGMEDGPTQLLGFGQGSFVSVVGFSADDRTVFAGSSDGTLWR
jgi:WD40 repeat protein